MALTGLAFAGMTRWIHGPDRRAFLPGRTTSGHHQIEIRCEVCHSPSGAVLSNACVKCHGEDMKKGLDSHPQTKFTDPRNADLLKVLDARECVACHVEHKPQWTHPMGVTLPMDYCAHCHQKIADDRPSHKGMGFSTCATAGCHNFHDNTALYEDFLAKHLQEPKLWPRPVLPAIQTPRSAEDPHPLRAALSLPQADAPAQAITDTALMGSWSRDAHARAGVNCTDCHGGGSSPTAGGAQAWSAHPAWQSCRTCHTSEAKTFLQGLHGMRLAQNLSPMRPELTNLARLPMKPAAAHRELTCVACHAAHGFDTREAAVNACLRCHDDGHSRAYLKSPHYQSFIRERDGLAPAGAGVSCASCHMPREMDPSDSTHWVYANHNQDATLRPNEKMLRPVCMRCHGLGFAIDALADSARIADNFAIAPHVHVTSLEMVTARIQNYAASKKSSPTP